MNNYKFFFIKICTLIIIAHALSCTNKTTELQEIKEIVQKNSVLNTASFKSIFIIDDRQCLNCNLSLSLLLKNYLNDKEILILITANPSKIDVSKYSKLNNVIFIDRDKYKNNKLLKYSKVIFITNNKLDTVININSKMLLQKLNYIETRLKKNI